MAWIESHQHLEKNGKVLEFANKLGINKYQAIGHLHALWWWALDNAEDGNLKRFSNATVTQACGWSEYIKDEKEMSKINEITNYDKHDLFVDALIECGFLDKTASGLIIHNWEFYTHRYFASVSKSTRKTELTRLRVEKHRKSNAHVTHKKRTVTLPTIPNHTLPNLKDKDIKTVSDGASPEPKPLTEIQKVITVYKIASGFEKDDKQWDKTFFGRYTRVAKELIEFMGNWKDAADCVQDSVEKIHAWNPEAKISIDTILTKHAAEWKKDKQEREAGRGILSH